MPWSEDVLQTWYSFTPPQVQAIVETAQAYLVSGARRIRIDQQDLVEVLQASGVRIEVEVTRELRTATSNAFVAEVEAHQRDLPANEEGVVILSARGFALVETPSRLASIHEAHRRLVEAFLQERGIKYTTDRRVRLGPEASQPLGVSAGPEEAEALAC